MQPRSIVYIDGFNLYYGAVRGGPFKWLDLQRYFSRLRQGDAIQRIKYFTALVEGPRQQNQLTYLRALDALPLVTVVYGKFKRKRVKCGVPECRHTGLRVFETAEEKRTDVNIALHMLDDGYNDRCDRFVVVSGDSDLVPAIQMVKSCWPQKRVIVYIPARNEVRGAAVEIRAAADKDRTLPLHLLQYCQLPPVVRAGDTKVCKPADW